MNTEIVTGSRVRVSVYYRGYHRRNFVGICKGWADSGLVKVKEDGADHIRMYSSDHVKLIKS